jgi:multiple sugar transport system permease protein
MITLRPKIFKGFQFILVYGALLIGLAFVLLPIVYTVSLSLRTDQEVMKVPPQLLPPHFTLTPYLHMSDFVPVFLLIRNTAFVTIGTTALAVTMAALGAYAFARLRFRFANQLMMLLLVSQMFPGSSLIVPLFKTLKSLGLYNQHSGLIVLYTGFTVPFCTWMLYGYFKTIPKELEDAALIDGCSRLYALAKVILPLALPGIAATAVFVMLAAWNEFTFAILFIPENSKWLITPALTSYIGQYRSAVNYMAAAAVTGSIPLIIAFTLVRRYFISGLVAGALKG